jgi:hypothetical protein
VQKLLSSHGATAVMVKYDKGDAVAMQFKIIVDGKALGYRLLIDGKAVVQVMRQHRMARQRLRDGSVHVGGWKPSPGLAQISSQHVIAAIPLGANRSSLLEARRALPGQYFSDHGADGARRPQNSSPSTPMGKFTHANAPK